MKKKLSYLLITIVVFCLFNINVDAEQLFKNEFSTDVDSMNGINIQSIKLPDFVGDLNLLDYPQTYNGLTAITSTFGTTATVPVPFNNGYLKIDVLEDSTNLLYLDATGNKIMSKEVKDEYIITGGVIRYLLDLTKDYNGKFYCLSINKNTHKIGTIVLNSNLEVEKKLDNKIMIGVIDGIFYFIDDEGISTSTGNLNNFIKFDILSLIPTNFPNLTNEDIDSLGKQIKYYLRLLPKYEWVVNLCYDDVVELAKITIDTMNRSDEGTITDEEREAAYSKMENIFSKNTVVSFIANNDFYDISDKYMLAINRETGNVKVLDSNGQIIFDKKLDCEYLYSIQLVHDYIAIFKDDGTETKIEIYDFNGNLVQTINAKENQIYMYLKENDGGFALTSVTMKLDQKSIRSLFINTSGDTENLIGKTQYNYKSEVYSMPQAITLNVTGDGNVSVSNTARFGEKVTLAVTIPKGQMLKKVRVYDTNGNEVAVENNEFTMPNSPITIAAEFVPELTENPKTGISSLKLIIPAGLCIASIAAYSCFKKKKINNILFKKI